MFASWKRFASALAVPMVLATACAPGDDGAETSEDDLNYRSTAGQEFSLTTDVTFKASEDVAALEGDEKAAALQKQADTLRSTVTTAIVTELDRLWPEDARTTSSGVAIEFRQLTAGESAPKALDGDAGYSITVAAEFSGEKQLLRKLPMKTVDGKTFLPIPATLDGGSVELQVVVTPIERSLNAYPHYMELFQDGLDIYVHVGGDHDVPPQDIDHARSIYDDLIASGFHSPVAKFEDLKLDSGPLVGKTMVQGAAVPVRVRIVDVDMSTPDTRQVLIDAWKDGMKTADVMIYDGHAGRQLDYSGVVVSYVPARVALPATAFRDVETTDKQQLYLFNGCETYTGYADELYLNPNRKPENTDVVTTGNFSAIQAKANQVIAFIHSLIDQKSGKWVPRSWDSILGRMNAVGERSWIHVYGVHGIDEDPKISPLADVSKVGVSCRRDDECGGADSKCIKTSSTRGICGAACADSSGCPTGTQCLQPHGTTSPDDMQCQKP